ncbi:MAG: molecular chaperone DnaK, partial [Thermoanaerobaculia bacterium]
SSADASAVESALADAKKALESGNAQTMNDAFARLEEASHKVAEAAYRKAAEPPPGASTGSASGEPSAGAGKEDEVIDTEYVDTEKK